MFPSVIFKSVKIFIDNNEDNKNNNKDSNKENNIFTYMEKQK